MLVNGVGWAAPSVEAHHCSEGPHAGRIPEEGG